MSVTESVAFGSVRPKCTTVCSVEKRCISIRKLDVSITRSESELEKKSSTLQVIHDQKCNLAQFDGLGRLHVRASDLLRKYILSLV